MTRIYGGVIKIRRCCLGVAVVAPCIAGAVRMSQAHRPADRLLPHVDHRPVCFREIVRARVGA